MRRFCVVGVVLAVSTASMVSGSGTANAATVITTHPVSLTAFSHLVVNGTDAFLSGDDAVEVHDLTGALVTTIANEPGADGMALSADGGELYVALHGADALSVIDTSTLAETSRIALPASSCPSDVALDGSTLWFSYGCTDGHVGSVDLSASTPNPVLDRLSSTAFTAPPTLAASPTVPGKLVVADAADRTGAAVLLEDVSGTAPVQTATVASSAVSDLQILSDGSAVLVNSPCCNAPSRLSMTDLSKMGGTLPGAATVAAGQGGVLAFSGTQGTYNTYQGSEYLGDLTTTATDGSVLTSLFLNAPNAAPVHLRHGLAFDTSGTHLVDVSTTSGHTHVTVTTDPGREGVSQQLSPTTSRPRINALFGIHERLFGTRTYPDSPTVTVTRTGPHGTVALADQHPTQNGGFYFTDKVTVRGTYTYAFSYAGSDAHQDNVTKLVMNVTGLDNGPVRITTSATKTYAFGAKPIITAHLGASTNRVVSLYAAPAGGKRVLIRRGVVDRNGNIGTRYALTHNTVVQAVWAGDDTYNPTTSSRSLQTGVHISTIVVGASGRSGAYYVVSHTKNPVIRYGVTPSHTGEYVSFSLEELIHGKWKSVGEGDATQKLGKGSQFVLGFTGTHRAGERARILFSYSGPIFAGNPTNAPTAAPPTYILFT